MIRFSAKRLCITVYVLISRYRDWITLLPMRIPCMGSQPFHLAQLAIYVTRIVFV